MLEPIWYKNYDEGVTPSIDYPDITLQEQFKHAVQQFPDNACTIFKNAVITYQKMDAITDSIAAGLVDMVWRKGTGWGSSWRIRRNL